MHKEVVNVVKSFLQFFIFKILDQIHNMFVIMLNSQFKSLQVVEKLVWMQFGLLLNINFKL
jgi:hypothetical protein